MFLFQKFSVALVTFFLSASNAVPRPQSGAPNPPGRCDVWNKVVIDQYRNVRVDDCGAFWDAMQKAAIAVTEPSCGDGAATFQTSIWLGSKVETILNQVNDVSNTWCHKP